MQQNTVGRQSVARRNGEDARSTAKVATSLVGELESYLLVYEPNEETAFQAFQPMCGIFGSIGLAHQPGERYSDDTRRGVDLLVHRGPDESGVVSHGSVSVGHSRLSIIDLDGGHQPMWSHDRRGLIVYNGEVYNHRDVADTLRRRGRELATRCDTEVVLNAYLEWGDPCVDKLRGMFAFVAIDFEKNTALLAVDRLGIKPLYFTESNGRLVFSSELEPLYRTVGPFALDPRGLDDYLAWQYIPAPRTIYRDVVALPPGHVAHVDLNTGRVSRNRYWRVEFQEDRSLSASDWQRRLDHEMREAVRLRLMSDVPFGAFLSGGIDSSLVTGYMAELLEEPVKTFSIGFKENDFSELPFAKQVAERNHTEHHVEIVESDSLGLLPTLVRHFGQPFADSSAIPTFHVARMASKHVKMVLSGDGGDESFAGYNSYEHILKGMSRPVRRGPGARNLARDLAAHFLWKAACWSHLADPVDRAFELHCLTSHHFAPNERRQLLRPRFSGAVRDHDRERRALMDVEGAPLISRLQHLDLMAYLPFDILTKVDRTSMASSLEVRVPLLDHVLVETAARMPSELKLRRHLGPRGFQWDKKYILKRIAAQRYPRSFVERPKMGFGVPLGRWFATSLRSEVQSRLLHSPVLFELMDRNAVRSRVESHSLTHDQSARIWNLLVLEEWLRTHDECLPAQ